MQKRENGAGSPFLGEDRQQLLEQVKHGTWKFPVGIYKNGYGHADVYAPHHWHREVEFICIEEGECEFTVNMKRIEVCPGRLYLINSGDIHTMRVPSKSRQNAVVFDLSMLSFEHYDNVQSGLIQPLLTGSLRFPEWVSGAQYLDTYQKIILLCQEKPAGYQVLVKASLLMLLGQMQMEQQLLKEKEIVPRQEMKLAAIKKVLTYIAEHYQEKIYIKELSSLVSMNEQYFCRFFKKNIGKTPTDYINACRIERACQMLEETNEKIVTVCYACGYENVGYFIRKFKQIKGMTPSEYVKII